MFTNQPSYLQSKSRLFVNAAAILGTACTLALPSHAQELQSIPPAPQLTRAEVTADLMRWRRAGMDQAQLLAMSYGVETEAYKRAYVGYLRLTDIERRLPVVAEPPRR